MPALRNSALWPARAEAGRRSLSWPRGRWRLSLNRSVCYKGQLSLLPRIEASLDVDGVPVPRTLEQAARDHAAVTAFAVNRKRRLAVQVGDGRVEGAKAPPTCTRYVSGLTLRGTADSQHPQRRQA